jgi:hypothetical protein
LGLALALPQIKSVDQLLQDRHLAAADLIDALTSIPGIELVRIRRQESRMAITLSSR